MNMLVDGAYASIMILMGLITVAIVGQGLFP